MHSNQILFRISLRILLITSLPLLIYITLYYNGPIEDDKIIVEEQQVTEIPKIKFINPRKHLKNDYNLWLIFTKVTKVSPLRFKFRDLLINLLNTTSVPLRFNIIIDDMSKEVATNTISDVVTKLSKTIQYKFYDVKACVKAISDIVGVMTPHFSSKKGSYYSDALFYISLGLHRIAPQNQDRAILLDCDLYFKKDIALLFDQFDSFKETALFGLAPELSPVYRHVLHSHRNKHNRTSFGNSYNTSALKPSSVIHDKSVSHPNGFQGYNSGVILFKFSAIRRSPEYASLLRNESVTAIIEKYEFKGHLGDQDFYTLVGYERPYLIQTLNCGFNRQLCVWWRDNGYEDVFDAYFQCRHPTVVLHGNCNTRISP